MADSAAARRGIVGPLALRPWHAAAGVATRVSRAARRPTIAVLGAAGAGGVLLLVAGALGPWLEVPLREQRRGTALPVIAAGLPSPAALSYGAVIIACASLAVVGMVRARGKRSALVGAAGAVALLACALFIVQTAVWDVGVRDLLVGQSVQQSTVQQQYGYNIRATVPDSVLFIPLSGSVRILVADLDQGFYLALAGAIAMLVSGGPAAARWVVRHHRAGAALAAAVILAVLAFCARGTAAGVALSWATDAMSRGDTADATSKLDLAVRLNPALRSDADYELALGMTQLQAGERDTPPALFADSRRAADAKDSVTQLADLDQAIRLNPADTVVAQEYRTVSVSLARILDDPTPLVALPPAIADDAVVEYSMGRLFFDRRSYGTAIPHLLRAAQLSVDRDLLSSVHTYIALSDMHLGRLVEARSHLLTAIADDTTYSNALARTMAVGLYTAQTP